MKTVPVPKRGRPGRSSPPAEAPTDLTDVPGTRGGAGTTRLAGLRGSLAARRADLLVVALLLAVSLVLFRLSLFEGWTFVGDSDRLNTLRQEVQVSEDAVEKYRSENGLLRARNPTVPGTEGITLEFAADHGLGALGFGIGQGQSNDYVCTYRERIKNCELKILPGAGHACQIEQPWLFNRLMIEFLRKHRLHPHG